MGKYFEHIDSQIGVLDSLIINAFRPQRSLSIGEFDYWSLDGMRIFKRDRKREWCDCHRGDDIANILYIYNVYYL